MKNLPYFLLKVGDVLIQLHSISGDTFHLNCDLIYRIDTQYDTVITLTDSKKLIVKENPQEIVEKVIEYKQQIHTKWGRDKL